MVKTRNELEKIICLAEEKARGYKHLFVNSGHILLAVVEKAEQKKYQGAFKKLFSASFREQIRQKFKKENPPGSNLTVIPEHLEKTPEFMETICCAKAEAQGIGTESECTIDRKIYVDYLLLGMIRHKTSIGGKIWRCIGPTLEKAREMVRNHQLQKTGKILRKKAKGLCKFDSIHHRLHKVNIV